MHIDVSEGHAANVGHGDRAAHADGAAAIRDRKFEGVFSLWQQQAVMA